jgi:Domain of unknown function (DUF222)
VCDNDPRTKAQRRADACGPLARREASMACLCGASDCATAAERQAVSGIVITVLAEQTTLDGNSDQPGYLPGFGILPADSVRDLAAAGATTKPLTMPSGAEPAYRPSTILAAFIRWRDLTCRFPGCDAPADVCDIDHTTPYPYGATHPSNNKLYCRSHHQVKPLRHACDGPFAAAGCLQSPASIRLISSTPVQQCASHLPSPLGRVAHTDE